MAVALQPGLAAALAGCSGPASTLDPAGPAASSIATLWWVMLAGSAVLFALVMVLFVLVIRRPGWGSSVSPARWIVLGGLVLPAVILPPLVAYALIAGERLLPLMGKGANCISGSSVMPAVFRSCTLPTGTCRRSTARRSPPKR